MNVHQIYHTKPHYKSSFKGVERPCAPAGVKGAALAPFKTVELSLLSPLSQNLSSLLTTAHLPSLFSLIKQAPNRLFFLFFLFIRYRSQKNEKIYCNNGQIIV